MEPTIEGGEPDPEKGPKVQFARFVSGELVLFSAYTSELEYIAVSHVFGKTGWHCIPGIKNEVLASPQKAVFIEKELPALVGDLPFWMDILTVNQRIQAEVISVVGAIPWIFRDAVQTLAIREDDGIYACCEKALEGIEGMERRFLALTVHYINHLDAVCDESYLRRLWTFQECLLSHSIRFVVCRRENHSEKNINECGRGYRRESNLWRLYFSVSILGADFGSDAGAEVSAENFTNAYFHGKTITRPKPRRRTVEEDIYTGSFMVGNLESQRAASEPRDYIYATMSPFPWYRYPPNAENIAFGELFLDLYNQAAEKRHTFAPKFTASMIDSGATDTSNAWHPSKQQPEPRCLGDFMKLLGNRLATELPNNVSCFHATTTVQVLAIDGDTHGEVLPMIQSAVRFSKAVWRGRLLGGELLGYGKVTDAAPVGSWPDPENSMNLLFRGMNNEDQAIITEEPTIEVATPRVALEDMFGSSTADYHAEYGTSLEYSRKVLSLALRASGVISPDPYSKAVYEQFQEYMESRWSKQLLRTLTLLTAMVNCRIGLSAAEWVRRHFVPVRIKYEKDYVVLGLLAKHALPSRKHESKQMMSVGRHLQATSFGSDLVLVDLAAPSAPVGIIPNFDRAHKSEEEFSRGMLVLYRGLGKYDDSGSFEFARISPESYAAKIAYAHAREPSG